MGNPLAPTLANFFVGHLEKTLFHDVEDTHPVLYLRYVDDVFCVFRKGVDFQHFLSTLNNLHSNLQFTYEYGGREIPFLDTKVSLNNKSVSTTVFRKKTDTGVVLNYTAIAPSKWKKSLVKCFLHRAHLVCSDIYSRNEEINKLREVFKKNNYPDEFFERELKVYDEQRSRKMANEDKDQQPENNEVEFKPFVKIPFIGKPSLLFAKRLARLIQNRMGKMIQVVYETVKVKDSFKLKDNVPKEISSRVVYKFSCPGDPDTAYIGSSNRTLNERVKEHLDFKREGSAVSQHITQCQACITKGITINNFVILRRCHDDFETRIVEALLIKRHNPKLNKQFSKSCAYSYTLKIFN